LTLVDTYGVSADSEAVPPICDALRTARASAGFTQAALAQRAQVSQERISLWERGREPDLATIRMLEEAIEPGRLRGWLLRMAGYVEDGEGLEAAIDMAPITPSQRDTLLRVLKTFESEA